MTENERKWAELYLMALEALAQECSDCAWFMIKPGWFAHLPTEIDRVKVALDTEPQSVV